jgi:hypothetical protein
MSNLLNSGPTFGRIGIIDKICNYEGCTVIANLELHHINPMVSIRKDITLATRITIQRSRKTITLCKKHHSLMHERRLLSIKDKKEQNDNPETDIE